MPTASRRSRTTPSQGQVFPSAATGEGRRRAPTPIVSEASPLRQRNLPLLLLQARERVIAHFRPVLKAHGLTEQQWRIVRALLDAGPLEPREIVELCRISSPSLAGVLARMDDLGLVQRERIEHDARRVKVSLTARSRALAARMAPRIEAVYAGLAQRLGEGRIDALLVVLDELIANLDAPDVGDPHQE